VRAPAFLNPSQTAVATLPREKAGHHPESYFRPHRIGVTAMTAWAVLVFCLLV
jgi:hypothetical protein